MRPAGGLWATSSFQAGFRLTAERQAEAEITQAPGGKAEPATQGLPPKN